MSSKDIFDLTVKTYETKLLHNKTSLKKIFNDPNIDTINGSINLQTIDDLINNCVNNEQKLSFLYEHKRLFIQIDNKKSTEIEFINANIKKEKNSETTNIKENKKLKIKSKSTDDDDIEVIDKPCNCSCNKKN